MRRHITGIGYELTKIPEMVSTPTKSMARDVTEDSYTPVITKSMYGEAAESKILNSDFWNRLNSNEVK